MARSRLFNRSPRVCELVHTCAIEALEERRLLTAYYSNGDSTVTTGNGSAAAPWNSLYAISIYSGFQPGDTVYLSGTFKNQEMYLEPAATGITLTSADPNHPATIAENVSYSFRNAIQVNTSGVTISYLNFVGPGITANSNNFYALLFDNLGTTQLIGATVDHVNASGFAFGGLSIHGNTSGFTNITITNSNFSNNQVSGLVIGSQSTALIHNNVLISNCVASHNAGFAVYYNANTPGGNENAGNGGIFIGAVNGGMVTNCTAIGNCYNSSGACGIWAHSCNAITFQYCEAGDTRTTVSGFDGNGFDFDNNVTNSLMQYDYSHGNDGKGMYICGFSGTKDNSNDTIRYCVSDDDGLKNNSSLALYSVTGARVINANIYNNTIIATETGANGAISVAGPAAASCTANFLNNVIYVVAGASNVGGAAVECGTFTPSSSNLKFEGNDYYSSGLTSKFKVLWGRTTGATPTPIAYTALAGTGSWIAGSGEETLSGTVVGLNVDPLFVAEAVSDLAITNVGNTALGMTSALRNAGRNLAIAPFSNTSPYNTGAPSYSVAGTAWSGVGMQDYFGNPIISNTTTNMGAGQTSSVTINGTAGTGDTITIKEDVANPHSVNVNSTVYKGYYSVLFNGSTGSETVVIDFVNGPLTDSAGVTTRAGVTFIGGSSTNTLIVKNSGAGTNTTMPINFVPGVSTNSLNVSTGSVVVPAGTQTGIRAATFSSINISAGSKVTVASPTTGQSNRTLVIVNNNGLTLAGSSNAWSSTLDLGSNDLEVKGGDLATLTNQIYQNWNSTLPFTGGIISTAVAADPSRKSLSIIRNTINGVSSGAILKTTFDSVAATSTDILIKFTYFGDDNLTGAVDASDYSRIDNAYLTQLTGWYNGDFNYDGVINGSDYTLIDNAFNTQGASLAATIAQPAKPVWVASHIFAESPAATLNFLEEDHRRRRAHHRPQLA